MNATASALIEGIKYAFGAEPTLVDGLWVPGPIPESSPGFKWNYIPSGKTGWFKYGSGGIQHFGSVCGIPNGAITVLSMMNIHSLFAEQIMLHYSQTEYPTKGFYEFWSEDPDPAWWGKKIPLSDGERLGYSISNSPLCHVAISKWAEAANVNLVESPGSQYYTHKVDRCANACADVAAFTAGLLNGLTSDYEMPDSTKACYHCHNAMENTALPAQQGEMDCLECHVDLRPHREKGWR
jgi:hypothetical protein